MIIEATKTCSEQAFLPDTMLPGVVSGTFVLVFAATGTSLEEMVQAFGARWTVEQCFEEAKGEVGLDDYEVRSWHGWYRHVTLSMFALAHLAALRASGNEDVLQKPEQPLRAPEGDSLNRRISSCKYCPTFFSKGIPSLSNTL